MEPYAGPSKLIDRQSVRHQDRPVEIQEGTLSHQQYKVVQEVEARLHQVELLGIQEVFEELCKTHHGILLNRLQKEHLAARYYKSIPSTGHSTAIGATSNSTWKTTGRPKVCQCGGPWPRSRREGLSFSP